jgi:beta-aspartyl-peptidase (threonine type)
MKRFCALAAVVILSVALAGCDNRKSKRTSEFALVVHGGAGTILRANMTPELDKQYRDALESALRAGYDILDQGGNALDAVETAAAVLEDSPLFNAGKGSVFTAQGTNEMDASIMDGSNLKAGAVASVTTIKNPIKAARRVMESTRHVMLVGRGAELFAAGEGLDIVDPEYFFTQRRWDELLKAKEKEKTKEHSSGRAHSEEELGTAAALALDRRGNLAAATSTGGLTNKMQGRVGDTPIIGAGTYANNATCAVSATGTGEYFMRGVLSHEVSSLMAHAKMSVEAAVTHVIDQQLKKLGGEGGIVALDYNGNVAMRFNTPGMYRGYVKDDGKYHVAIYGDE